MPIDCENIITWCKIYLTIPYTHNEEEKKNSRYARLSSPQIHANTCARSTANHLIAVRSRSADCNWGLFVQRSSSQPLTPPVRPIPVHTHTIVVCLLFSCASHNNNRSTGNFYCSNNQSIIRPERGVLCVSIAKTGGRNRPNCVWKNRFSGRQPPLPPVWCAAGKLRSQNAANHRRRGFVSEGRLIRRVPRSHSLRVP